MDTGIEQLIQMTKEKFGLDDYFLKTYSLSRHVNVFKDTVYTLNMEWFPSHGQDYDEDGSNPEGTAVIEMDVNTQQYKSVIFVHGISYAHNGVCFAAPEKEAIIKWLEQETNLTYEKQFLLHKEEEGKYHFKSCVDGIKMIPPIDLWVEFDQEGKLTFFSLYGEYPAWETEKADHDNFEVNEDIAKGQLTLEEFPIFNKEKIIPVYFVEEAFITKDKMFKLPLPLLKNENASIEMKEVIHWDEPLNEPFVRKEPDLREEISAGDAFSMKPSPDLRPITKEEQEKCMLAVQNCLRKVYPADSGRWVLKTLHRDAGYIHAILNEKDEKSFFMQRKLSVIIDGENYEAINYIDNEPLLEICNKLEKPDKITITKDDAYEKLKEHITIKPVYVYFSEKNKFVLCGELYCEYGVNAENGEVFLLEDL